MINGTKVGNVVQINSNALNLNVQTTLYKVSWDSSVSIVPMDWKTGVQSLIEPGEFSSGLCIQADLGPLVQWILGALSQG
jgi:hypothetical protein